MVTSEREVRVGVLLFDDVEVLDAAGPFEVFSTAGRLVRTPDDRPAVVCTTVAATTAPIVARGGLRFVPDHDLAGAPALDVLVVPGGVTAAVERDPAVIRWLAERHAAAELTLGVCSGAFLLAEAGVLDGRPATTHWADEDELATRWPAVEVRREPRWVDDGDVVTSAGISAGIDASLHVVSRLFGPDLAAATAHRMEYAWRSTP
jgi:transcriptional regulator GlxA family with amidase domain